MTVVSNFDDFKVVFERFWKNDTTWGGLNNQQRDSVVSYAYGRSKQSEKIYNRDPKLLAPDSEETLLIGSTATTEKLAFQVALLVGDEEFFSQVMRAADTIAFLRTSTTT